MSEKVNKVELSDLDLEAVNGGTGITPSQQTGLYSFVAGMVFKKRSNGVRYRIKYDTTVDLSQDAKATVKVGPFDSTYYEEVAATVLINDCDLVEYDKWFPTN